jgi:dual-specificity kinase
MVDPDYSDGAAYRDDDPGHYNYKQGNMLSSYQIVNHLGDGTFGRTLKGQNIKDQQYYAVKIIRAVKRYNSSAKIEIKILNDIRNKGGDKHNIVLMHESFMHQENNDEHTCLVFEPLGKSLFDFIKSNKYYGFGLKQIQNIAKQVLVGVKFMHENMKLTHTDLKPENILLKLDTRKCILERHLWPI